jgi:hypothetical protein
MQTTISTQAAKPANETNQVSSTAWKQEGRLKYCCKELHFLRAFQLYLLTTLLIYKPFDPCKVLYVQAQTPNWYSLKPDDGLFCM